jgi:hypothetical protein
MTVPGRVGRRKYLLAGGTLNAVKEVAGEGMRIFL